MQGVGCQDQSPTVFSSSSHRPACLHRSTISRENILNQQRFQKNDRLMRIRALRGEGTLQPPEISFRVRIYPCQRQNISDLENTCLCPELEVECYTQQFASSYRFRSRNLEAIASRACPGVQAESTKCSRMREIYEVWWGRCGLCQRPHFNLD